MANVDRFVPDAAEEQKELGDSLYVVNDFEGAIQSYETALAIVFESTKDRVLVSPDQEIFVLALYSDLASVFLETDQLQLALECIRKAQVLPVFQIQVSNDVREKILSRHVEALLALRQQLFPATTDDDDDDTWEKDRLDKEIRETLDKVQLWRYLVNSSSLEACCAFFRYGGMAEARQSDGRISTNESFQAWTDRLVRSGACTDEQAVVARDQFQQFLSQEIYMPI